MYNYTIRKHVKITQDRYPPSDKIAMVRSVRFLTRLLGKLGIKKLMIDNREWIRTQPARVKSRPPWPAVMEYGFSLKEAKDWVENYMKRAGIKD